MKYAVVAASVFAGDFFLKKHMEEQRDMQERTEILGGKLELKKYHNSGLRGGAEFYGKTAETGEKGQRRNSSGFEPSVVWYVTKREKSRCTGGAEPCFRRRSQ